MGSTVGGIGGVGSIGTVGVISGDGLGDIAIVGVTAGDNVGAGLAGEASVDGAKLGGSNVTIGVTVGGIVGVIGGVGSIGTVGGISGDGLGVIVGCIEADAAGETEGTGLTGDIAGDTPCVGINTGVTDGAPIVHIQRLQMLSAGHPFGTAAASQLSFASIVPSPHVPAGKVSRGSSGGGSGGIGGEDNGEVIPT